MKQFFFFYKCCKINIDFLKKCYFLFKLTFIFLIFRLLQRVNDQNQEINRLMETIREMGIREKKWDEVKRAMRGQEIELSQLREENYNYENLVKRLRKELEEKNGLKL